MTQILFFALTDDLRTLLEQVESKGALCYALMGNFQSKDVIGGVSVFEGCSALPHLGVANASSSSACNSYLVCERETPIKSRILQGLDSERTCVDQLTNPDSVGLTPGGIWNKDIVIQGRVATASDSKASRDLLKRFQVAIKKTFSKVKAFYVGPAALSLLERGKRLTSSEQSPLEYDLSITAQIDP